jgi:hypothetical protein
MTKTKRTTCQIGHTPTADRQLQGKAIAIANKES